MYMVCAVAPQHPVRCISMLPGNGQLMMPITLRQLSLVSQASKCRTFYNIGSLDALSFVRFFMNIRLMLGVVSESIHTYACMILSSM